MNGLPDRWRQSKRRPVPFSLIAVTLILMLVLSGCVYLRLLKFKHQLVKFDEFFRVEVTDRFTLHFLKPMLFAKDFIHLSKFQPSRKHPLPNGERWNYIFYKIDPDGNVSIPHVSVVFEMVFNEKKRLRSFTLSPIFLAMTPPEFLKISLRSLGTAKVDKKKRQVRADSASLPKTQLELPKRDTIVNVLGLPFDIQDQEDGSQLYLYHFRLETSGYQPKYEERRLAVAKLYFDPDTGELLKMWGRFAGLKIAIDYRNLTESKPVEPVTN